jgi:hypothetical protein
MNIGMLKNSSTIDRHLRHAQDEAVFGSPMSVPAPEGEGGADASDEYLCAYAQQLASALNDVLDRYVDLLESSEHGGWSRAEDQFVQSVRSLLSQSRRLQ